MLASEFSPKQEILIVITLLLLFVGSFTDYALAQTSSNANSTQRKSIPSASLPPINNLEEFTAKNSRIGFSLGPGSPSDPSIHYFIVNIPSNGQILGVNRSNAEVPGAPNVIYVPKHDFTGFDFFSFKVRNSSTDSKPILVQINVQPDRSTDIPHIVLAFAVAFISVVIITFMVGAIIRRTKSIINPTLRSRFSDIIRTYDMDPSLSIFQFLLWTFVLMFAFIGVYLVRIFAGVSEPPQGPLPVYLLAIGGISVGTPIISTLISSYRYSPVQFHEDVPPDTDDQLPVIKKRPGFGEMLREYGKPTLSRFQMFGWTWIGIGIYLSVLFSKVIEMSFSVQNLSVPDVDPTLVVLMGLSQFAFLGIKTASSTDLQISKIYPLNAEPDRFFSIFGKNFGEERQTVWLGRRRIVSTDTDHLDTWSSDRIDIKVPNDKDTPVGTYEVMVVKGGVSKIAKDKFTVIGPPTLEPTPTPTGNRPPVAVVGPDQMVNQGSTVVLDGSASHDPDGDPITFTWLQTSGPTVVLSNANTAKTTFTAPSNITSDTTIVCKLTVTDKFGLSNSESAKVKVKHIAS